MDKKILKRIQDLSGILTESDDTQAIIDAANKNALVLQDNKPVGKIREFLPSQVDANKAYTLFRITYELSSGQSWSFQKFMSRFPNWHMVGNEKGFVAYRIQRNGLLKIVGAGGSPMSIVKGMIKLMNTGKPIWGMVSKKIRDMAEKGGFLCPSPEANKAIMSMIGSEVFGFEKFTVNNDGSVVFHYTDIGDQKKYFIGNKEYYKWLFNQMKGKLGDNKIRQMIGDPAMQGFAKMIGMD